VTGVREAIDAWTAAILRSDSDAADAVLHTDFALQSAGGYGDVDKASWLAGLKVIDTRSLEALELDIREFDDVAVVAGRWRWDASAPERELTGGYAITDVLLRVDGAWRPRWRISTKIGE
jgi:Domain of unknown function (DUF4440)